jgi:hypothetical protein
MSNSPMVTSMIPANQTQPTHPVTVVPVRDIMRIPLLDRDAALATSGCVHSSSSRVLHPRLRGRVDGREDSLQHRAGSGPAQDVADLADVADQEQLDTQGIEFLCAPSDPDPQVAREAGAGWRF